MCDGSACGWLAGDGGTSVSDGVGDGDALLAEISDNFVEEAVYKLTFWVWLLLRNIVLWPYICLSVYPSEAGVLSKWLNVSSQTMPLIAQEL